MNLIAKDNLVSIVIPAYNVEDYISYCLDTVVNQTYSNIEIIVINDCSTDGTADVCEKYAECDDRFILVSNDKNVGQGESRNRGVSMAKGDYLMFVDSDDWLELDAVENLLIQMIQYDADIVVGDRYSNWPDKQTLSEIRLKSGVVYYPDWDKQVIVRARAVLWGNLYRMEHYRRCNILQPDVAMEDVAVTPYIIATARSVVRCAVPVYHYRRLREGSTCNNPAKILEAPKALTFLCEKFRSENLYEKYREELELFAFGQIRFYIKRLQEICGNGSDIDKELQLIEFMDKEFPGWFNPMGKVLTIWSDFSENRRILDNIAFDSQKVQWTNKKPEVQNPDSFTIHIRDEALTETDRWNISDRIYYVLRKMNNDSDSNIYYYK